MGDCAQSCPVAARVDALEGQMDEVQTQNTSSHKEIFSRLNSLEKAEAVQGVHYASIMAKLDNLTAKVEQLEQKPAKRWETVIAAAISALVTGVAVFLLSGGRIG